MPAKTRRSWSEPLVLKLVERHRGRAPEAIIEQHADRLRREAEQDKLPIDVDLVASVAGVKRRRRVWDFAGRIYAEPTGQLVMDLNEADPEPRQRFTCAHELMHVAFPGFRKETRYRLDTLAPGRNGRNAEEEYLCDLGAAALLMPRELVEDAYSVREGLAAMERLAGDAEVSLEAAGNRLISVCAAPAVFLVFEWAHKPADQPRLRRGEDISKRLRVRYATVANLDAYLPRFKSAPDSSAFCRAWESPFRVQGRELLPGAEHLGPFQVEAKTYGADERRRVLALAWRS